MIKEAIKKLVEYKNLDFKETRQAFLEILEGRCSFEQVASFLTALRMKTETEEELRAVVEVMREKSIKIKVNSKIVFDTCGTGGKRIRTFNISTCTAFVVAAGGIKVAKHGNRSFSSFCGSADIIEKLGIELNLSPEVVESCLKKIGIGFFYAPLYHPAMRKVAPVRAALGIRTIFNLAGPLCNPARANFQLLGVYAQELTEKIARVLKKIGTERAYVVSSKDIGDEISLSGPTKVSELRNGRIRTFWVNPEDFGFRRRAISKFKTNSPQENLQTILSVLRGEESPYLELVLANAGACFVLVEKASTFKEGMRLARKYIEEKKALQKLEALKEYIREIKKNISSRKNA